MSKPRVLILRAPGTNCDAETAYAFAEAGAEPRTLHVNRVLESDDELRTAQILCVPGGFSYGDDIGAGRIFAQQLRARLAGALAEFIGRDTLVLGICNGFQVLLQTGIFTPDSAGQGAPAALAWNDSGRFEARWVHLAVANPRCSFLLGIERLYLPVAHAEGRFVPRNPATLDQLTGRDQIALRYARADGSSVEALEYPANPNGSVAAIAGLCDPSGRVLGLMPHPERFIFHTQHPQWTRGGVQAEGDGMGVFRNAVRYFG